jgi:hypothetical protein
MTTIVLCALSDQKYHRSSVYTMTVKRVSALPSCDLLVPPAALVYGHKHAGGDARFCQYRPVSDQQYIDGYRQVIEQRLPRIARWYRMLPLDNTTTLTLCCYCAEGAFCHRQLVYKLFLWLNRKYNLPHCVELH